MIIGIHQGKVVVKNSVRLEHVPQGIKQVWEFGLRLLNICCMFQVCISRGNKPNQPKGFVFVFVLNRDSYPWQVWKC